jgi:hypothetical protein
MNDPEFKERANQHWEYIKSLLEMHGSDKEIIKLIGFHYTTAMIHGHKHGKQDTLEELRKRKLIA